MKLDSLNSTCTKQNPQFGAVRLKLTDAHQLKLKGEGHIPGSLRFIMDRLHEHKSLETDTFESVIKLMENDDVILKPKEIVGLKRTVKNGQVALKTKLEQLVADSNGKRIDLKKLLPEGYGVIEALLTKNFGTPKAKSLDELHALNSEVRQLRTFLFEESEKGNLKHIHTESVEPVDTIVDAAEEFVRVPTLRFAPPADAS